MRLAAAEKLSGLLRVRMRAGPFRIYFLGLTLHLFYLLVLYISPAAKYNLELPEGGSSDNLWKGRDVMTYVEPARNALEHGVFGRDGEPDHHRTIGYPFFLALMMWLLCTHLAQAALFALLYPILASMGFMLFGRRFRLAPLLLFLLLAGTYWSKVPIIMTDCFFTLLFTLGLYFGLRSVRGRGILDFVLYLLFVGAAAQVRPTLILYPFLHLALYPAAAAQAARIDRAERLTRPAVMKRLAIAFVLLLPLCNAPTLRNALHHGLYKPADAFEKGLFDALAQDVLIRGGRADLYRQMQSDVEAADDLKQRLALKRAYALEVYRDDPLGTAEVLVRNAVRILGNSHLLSVAHFWGRHWRDFDSEKHMPLRGSIVLAAVNTVSYLVYAALYLGFILSLLRCVRSGSFWSAFAVLLLTAYLIVPTFMLRSDARVRLPVEGLVLLFAVPVLPGLKEGR